LFLITYIFLLAFIIFIPLLQTTVSESQAVVSMDVKCTVYSHSDDVNGNNVDVRILVLGLRSNTEYTAQVTPDHNPPTSVSEKTDSGGIFWTVAKVPNGEKSILFKVNVYEGKDTAKEALVASGDDDAPCYTILFPWQITKQ
jgi:hypothetical protein